MGAPDCGLTSQLVGVASAKGASLSPLSGPPAPCPYPFKEKSPLAGAAPPPPWHSQPARDACCSFPQLRVRGAAVRALLEISLLFASGVRVPGLSERRGRLLTQLGPTTLSRDAAYRVARPGAPTCHPLRPGRWGLLRGGCSEKFQTTAHSRHRTYPEAERDASSLRLQGLGGG